MSALLLCSEGVTRKGEFQPCEKPAVALRYDEEGAVPYEVCAFHCRAPMVPLSAFHQYLTEGPE